MKNHYENAYNGSGAGDPQLPEVHFSKADGWKGVTIGLEDLFLAVDRGGQRWKFRLADLHGRWTWLTGWVTLDGPESLRESRRMKPIIRELKSWYRKVWERIVERVVAVVQDNAGEWKPEEAKKDEPTPGEILEEEKEQQSGVTLHPLIDYHKETGFTIGPLLHTHQKSLIITPENVILADFGAPLKHEAFANNVSVKRPSGCFLEPVHNRQILNVAGEQLSSRKIKFDAPSEVFGRVLRKEGGYWWHPDSRYLTAAACWTIGTYLHPIFDVYPILHLQGVRESGKSTFLWLLRVLAWNPTSPEASLRGADLFRTIEGSRPTYLVDVARLGSRGPGAQDVIDVFELGYEQGGQVRRCHPETLEPLKFDVYSPKAVASRTELPFDAKCIRIITEKAEDPEYTRRRAFLKRDPEAPEIVGALIRCCLNSWKPILAAYEGLEQTDQLRGRRFRLWSPLLAVCRVFAPHRFGELLRLAEEDAMMVETGDRVSEVEECVLSVLLAPVEPQVTWLLKDLTEEVQERVPWVKDWHIVKSAVTNLGIAKERRHTSAGVTIRFDMERVAARARKRGILEEEAGQPAGPPAEKPASAELLDVLRRGWQSGTSEEFEDLAMERGDLSREEARSFREGLVDEGLLAYDPEGWLVWVT